MKFNSIIKNIKKNGFTKSLIESLKYRLGILDLESQNETLFYLLDKCVDITQLPPTSDSDLRILQKCETVVLAIFDRLCQMHGLRYWLDYGTLLGAYRHKGFIPWDDDVDITMPREDMDKVIPILKEKIERMGFEFEDRSGHPLRCYCICYKKALTGIQLDIFPEDEYYSYEDKEKARRELQSVVDEYRKFYWENTDLSLEELREVKSKMLSRIKSGEKLYHIRVVEGFSKLAVNDANEIYPIKSCQFENYIFNVPANTNRYLIEIYGQNFMKFPRRAKNTHGDSLNMPLSHRAKHNCINMNEIYDELLSIYRKL